MEYGSVVNIRWLFYGCSNLESLPDISKWNTINIIDAREICFGCQSLLKFPDISKWKLNNIQKMEDMFYSCSNLVSYPDITKWALKKNIPLFFNSESMKGPSSSDFMSSEESFESINDTLKEKEIEELLIVYKMGNSTDLRDYEKNNNYYETFYN